MSGPWVEVGLERCQERWERTGRQLWEKEGRVYRRRRFRHFQRGKTKKANTKNSLKETVERNLSWSIKEPTEQYETTLFFYVIYTVIRFLWVSAKFSTFTVVRVNRTLVEDKMRSLKGECEHFRFNKCPIYTHDGASAKFSTNSQGMDNSVYCRLSAKIRSIFICAM